MKRLLLAVIFLFSPTSILARDTIKLVYFDNIPPLSWKNDNVMQSLLVDVVTEAIQTRMGINVSNEGFPWTRAQNFVKNGYADAFVTVPTPERKTYTEVSEEPVVVAAFTLFVKTGNPIIGKLENVITVSDLKGFKLGHYLGSGWAEKNLAGMDVDTAATLDSTLKKLIAGRFDVFIDVS